MKYISQRKADTVWCLLYVESKTNQTHEVRNQINSFWRRGVLEGADESRQSKAHASSYKMNEVWGPSVQQGEHG